MNQSNTAAELVIQDLIRGTISRAWTETTACGVVLLAFTRILLSTEAGSPRFYGCLLILIGTGFVAGVVWSFTLGYKLLESHPASDLGFWRAAFQTQAKLLRLVPFWYCAPLGLGIPLFFAPLEPGTLGIVGVMAAAIVALFAFIIWLNRQAADQLEKESLRLSQLCDTGQRADA